MRISYFNTPPVVKNLIIANCVIYLAMTLIPAVNYLFSEYLQLFWVGSQYYHSYQFVT